MRKALGFLIAAQALVAVAFAWRYAIWSGWQRVGPDAFPGSPDAAFLYENAKSSAQWTAAILLALWLAGWSALWVIHRNRVTQNFRRVVLLGRVAIAVPPITVLAALILLRAELI